MKLYVLVYSSVVFFLMFSCLDATSNMSNIDENILTINGRNVVVGNNVELNSEQKEAISQGKYFFQISDKDKYEKSCGQVVDSWSGNIINGQISINWWTEDKKEYCKSYWRHNYDIPNMIQIWLEIKSQSDELLLKSNIAKIEKHKYSDSPENSFYLSLSLVVQPALNKSGLDKQITGILDYNDRGDFKLKPGVRCCIIERFEVTGSVLENNMIHKGLSVIQVARIGQEVPKQLDRIQDYKDEDIFTPKQDIPCDNDVTDKKPYVVINWGHDESCVIPTNIRGKSRYESNY